MKQQQHHQTEKRKKGVVKTKLATGNPLLDRTILCFLSNPEQTEEEQAWSYEFMRQYCEDRDAKTALHYYANSVPPLRLYAQLFGTESNLRNVSKITSDLGLRYDTLLLRSLADLPPDILEGEKGDESETPQ